MRGALVSSNLAKSRPSGSLAVHKGGSEDTSSNNEADKIAEKATRSSPCTNADPRVRAAIHQFTQDAYGHYQQGAPNLGHLRILLQVNVNIAFDYNSKTLGMSLAHHDYDAISPFNKQGPLLGKNYSSEAHNWPESLQPTTLQFSKEHHPWIDLFPFPRLRDNILMAIEEPGVCDEDELCHDLCHYSGDKGSRAGLVVWGEASNPYNWELSTEFLEKWGYLLYACPELLEATNHWRARRNEKTISTRAFAEAIVRTDPRVLQLCRN